MSKAALACTEPAPAGPAPTYASARTPPPTPSRYPATATASGPPSEPGPESESDSSTDPQTPLLRILHTPVSLGTRLLNSIRLVLFLILLFFQDSFAYYGSGSRSAASGLSSTDSPGRKDVSEGGGGGGTTATSNKDGRGWGTSWHWIAGRRKRARREVVGALEWAFGWLPFVVLGLVGLGAAWMLGRAGGMIQWILSCGVSAFGTFLS